MTASDSPSSQNKRKDGIIVTETRRLRISVARTGGLTLDDLRELILEADEQNADGSTPVLVPGVFAGEALCGSLSLVGEDVDRRRI